MHNTSSPQVDEESGEVSVTEPRKLRGIGLVDFPAEQLKAAIQAGVPITCVQVGPGCALQYPARREGIAVPGQRTPIARH